MTKRSELGTRGEDVACRYLADHGYAIIERNAWQPWGEIDIVAKSPEGKLVFVEVKTTRESSILKPEDQMTASKLKKFKKAASLYAGSHQNLVGKRAGWRLDVIALLESEKGFKTRHYKNI